jgi:hypothetical protein
MEDGDMVGINRKLLAAGAPAAGHPLASGPRRQLGLAGLVLRLTHQIEVLVLTSARDIAVLLDHPDALN